MSRIVSQQVKQQASTGAGQGTQYTEEEKQEWNNKWARFAKLFANRPLGATRTFVGKVISISDPKEVENTYPGVAPGTMKVVRDIIVECTQPGLEGLRWITSSADNVLNDKTKLYKLYSIRYGQPPVGVIGQTFEYDVDELEGIEVEFTLKKGRERQDGKRGGFSSNLTVIEGHYPDTDEEVPAPAPKPATPAARPATPAKTAVGIDDDLPF